MIAITKCRTGWKFPVPPFHLTTALILASVLTACGGGNDNSSSLAALAASSAATTADQGLGPVVGTQNVECKDYYNNPVMVKPKTVTINNHSDRTIYPVLYIGNKDVDEWAQACFRSSDAYKTSVVSKLFINKDQGIPANSSITVTLPVMSNFPDGGHVTWWNGGRVVLADETETLFDPDQDKSVAVPANVSCQGLGTSCTMNLYSSSISVPDSGYSQLTEYTFGDSNPPEGQTVRMLHPGNVGYNISYVDHVYLPVAMGPKGNPYIGYSGSALSIEKFTGALNSFLADPLGNGWPVYNIRKVKIPGGYNIFAQRDGPQPPNVNAPYRPAGNNSPSPLLTLPQCIAGQCTDPQQAQYGEAVQRIQNLWGSCTTWDAADIQTYVTQQVACPANLQKDITDLKAFFAANYQIYNDQYATKCGDPAKKVPFDLMQVLLHVYGWVPFNDKCNDSAFNPLASTKTADGLDHATIQARYIHDMQYNYKDPAVTTNFIFNPYNKLIHGILDMNAYGFSVDDAVGFMSELGEGLIINVGDSRGLQNTDKFSFADGFVVAAGYPSTFRTPNPTKPLLKKYGACVMGQDANDKNCEADKEDVDLTANIGLSGFRIGTVSGYPLKVRFTDYEDNTYQFIVTSKFPECNSTDISKCQPRQSDVIDLGSCLVLTPDGKTKHAKSDDWCRGIVPNMALKGVGLSQSQKPVVQNYISVSGPVSIMHLP